MYGMRIYINEETHDLCWFCEAKFRSLGPFEPFSGGHPDRRLEVANALESLGITALCDLADPDDEHETYFLVDDPNEPDDLYGYECSACGTDISARA